MMKKRIIIILISLYQNPVWAQGRVVAGISAHEALKVILGLLLVLALITAFAWVVKKLHLHSYASNRGISVLSSLSLGPKEKIMLIKAGERYLLVGVGSASINSLIDYGTTEPLGFPGMETPSFKDLMKSALRKKNETKP